MEKIAEERDCFDNLDFMTRGTGGVAEILKIPPATLHSKMKKVRNTKDRCELVLHFARTVAKLGFIIYRTYPAFGIKYRK
jgi:hypothetical protein